MTITKPIYEATVSGKPLRFFASPLLDGKPDFPWHSVDDLQRCIGMSREERNFFYGSERSPYRFKPLRRRTGP